MTSKIGSASESQCLPPPVIARESFGKLRINSTTEAIPFLKTNVIMTYIAYLNRYDLDRIYITNIRKIT